MDMTAAYATLANNQANPFTELVSVRADEIVKTDLIKSRGSWRTIREITEVTENGITYRRFHFPTHTGRAPADRILEIHRMIRWS